MYFLGLQQNNLLNKALALCAVFALVFYPFILSAEDVGTTEADDYPVIETGDAVATTDIENEVNTNEAEIEGDDSTQNESTQDEEEASEESEENPPVPEEEQATTEEEVVVEETGEAEATLTQATSTPLSIDVEIENEAEVINEVDTEANTGGNEIIGDAGVIVTGDSYAGANVLNVVNTNIFNSFGFFYLLNQFFGFDGHIDLRDFQNASTSPPSLCSSGDGCSAQIAPSSETISSTSTADISNTVLVRSNTGGNVDSAGIIATGDSYASANVVNVANTNIIDSNYLLFTLNNFGGLGGDLVLPNDDFFTGFFFGGGRTANSGVDVSTDNTAEITTSVTTAASTGENTAVNGGNIQTGDAYAGTNVVNQINSNFFGGSNLRILIRIHGNWLGDVFNAPPGVYWRETDSGVELYGAPDAELTSGAASNLSKLTVDATNTASIHNDVQVQALTGDNLLGEGDIYTGNAYASANVVNVANTNIMGQNWILAIVNIFGDWAGNVSFGMPDLWVGTQVEVPEKNFFGQSEEVRYRFTIINHGDADASGVRLLTKFDKPQFISFEEGYNYIDPEKGITGWDIGNIPAGGMVEVTYDAKISPEIPYQDTNIVATTNVVLTETDADLIDNRDLLTILATSFIPGRTGVQNLTFTPDPEIIVTKTNDVFFPTAGTTTVNYRIVIKNEGGIAHHAVLIDTLKNEYGEVLNEQQWELDDIYPNEEIEVTYTSIFSADTPGGVYTNYAQVKATGRHPSLVPFYGYIADSNIATSSNTIIEVPPTPVVTATEEFVEEEVATTAPPAVIKRAIVATEIPKDSGNITPMPAEMPFYAPFSPLLHKVFAFKDSITAPKLPDQKAAVFSAFNRKNIQDTYFLALALLASYLISDVLLRRTRLRNAFTSF